MTIISQEFAQTTNHQDICLFSSNPNLMLTDTSQVSRSRLMTRLQLACFPPTTHVYSTSRCKMNVCIVFRDIRGGLLFIRLLKRRKKRRERGDQRFLALFTSCQRFGVLLNLEVDNGVLATLLTANLEALATLHDLEGTMLADGAFQTEHNLLSSLGLLVEDGLGLTTITSLLAIVTTLTLGIETGSTGLVLGHLVLGVLTALRAVAQNTTGLGNVHHFSMTICINRFAQAQQAKQKKGQHGLV